jgi:hypothetical protein
MLMSVTVVEDLMLLRRLTWRSFIDSSRDWFIAESMIRGVLKEMIASGQPSTIYAVAMPEMLALSG